MSWPASELVTMTKWVYAFGDGKAEGEAGMKNLLGGKGANLAEMSNLGLPVPPGLTITTEVCTYYYANKESYPPDLKDQVGSALREGRLSGQGQFRRSRQAAAAQRALGRARLHARHDGHGAESGPQRRHRRRPGQADRRRTLCL